MANKENDEEVEGPYRVLGTVTDAGGREIAGAEITLWQQKIRSRRRLMTGRTSKEGEYRLSYRPPDDVPGRLLIIVEARSNRLRAPLESPVTPAQQVLRIDLQATPPDQSEYGLLLRAIGPALENLTLLDVVENDEHHDISFLAEEIGHEAEEIMRAVVSARLEAAYGVPAVVFYAFLRQNVPAALPAPLIDASQSFTLIDALVRRIGSLILALSVDVQTSTLEAAVSQNLIGVDLAAQIPELVKQLQAQRSSDVLSMPYLVGKATLGQLLDLAELPKSKQDLLANLLVTNTQTMRNFWRTLADGQHGLTAAEASSVQRTLELGAFVSNHLPLVQTLQQDFAKGTYKSIADLAHLSEEDWVKLVNQVGVPPNISAAGAASPAEVYARVIYTRVTRAYPTVGLVSRIPSAGFIPEPERAPLTQFFANNTALDLGRLNLAIYLDQQGESAFTGMNDGDRPAVVVNVKRLQRVLRITADVDHAQTLLGLGIHSAAQIATMGRQQFASKAIEAGLTRRQAYRLYEAGAQRYGSLVSTVTQYNRDLIGPWPKFVGSTSDLDEPTKDAIARNQSLATLFGSQDYCRVDSCTSVLSPAAYLCDLLLWLRNHPLRGHYSTALTALFDRRPDLGHLLLNCPNTEVPLPYIDLVNELLEDAVSPPMAPVWRQTTWTAAELRAAPEYVNTGAYAKLATASYPHTLPYDSTIDELRTYLQQSGIALWQLRRALLALHNPTLGQRASVAAERFGMATHEQDLIVNANFVASSVAWNTANPTTDLVPVRAFLESASITYEQLLQLLEVVWIRGGGVPITLQGIDDTCDLSKQSLAPTPLDAGFLDRTHRFLRLWRHAGWRMWEADLLLRAPLVGNGVLDENSLVALYDFRVLQDATGLAADEQLTFFQDIDDDVNGHLEADGTRTTSLFARIFLDPAVPPDPDIAALPGGGPIADPALAHHLPAIQAAVQVSAPDANTLFGLTNGQLTAGNLSQIYRAIALARAVKLPLTDLLRIAPLTTSGSLNAAFANPAAALELIQQIKALQQSGFTIDALVYVLTTQPTTLGKTIGQIANTILPAVRGAIEQTHDDVFGSPDPPLTILARELAQLPRFADPTLLATAISIVDDIYTDTLANRNSFIAANFRLFMNPATAQADLVPLSPGLTNAQRHAEIDLRSRQVLTPLATYLTETRVIAALASSLQLPNDVTALLVRELQVPGTALPLLAVLTDPALIGKVGGNYTPITPPNFPNQFLAVQLVDKVAVVVRRLHLVKDDLSWLLTNAAVYGGLDLRQLPVKNTQPPLTMAPLLATSLLVKLDRASGSAPPSAPIQSLYELVTAVSTGAIVSETVAQTALAAITGWTADDIAALATAIGVSFGGGDYTRPATYDAIRTLEAMRDATGSSGQQLVSWGVAVPDATAAASARGVLKSHHSNADWLKVAPAMMDPIRERRSAGLQAYLLAQRDNQGALIYGDTNALFDHFLIDVQMSSCEVTTRVIQAYAAVQLFVERCLMGLEEPNVVVDLTRDDTWSQWQWMKRYRIWEANRKVFAYPENFLIETQRPNRTEIFQRLEHEVHQSESTLDYLETVVLNYIDRLEEVSHLLVTGTCLDNVTGAVHVVGRTQADPPRFYHRTFADGAWTGWQQIPFDIKAHQVVPSVYRNRLCLFWPEVMVTNEPRQQLPPVQPNPSPPPQDAAKYTSVGLGFTTFRNGAWAPPQRAKGKLFDVPPLSSEAVSDSRSAEALYTLKTWVAGSNLWVDVFRLGIYPVRRRTSLNPAVRIGTPVSTDTVVLAGSTATGITIGPPLIMDTATHLGRAVFDGRFGDLELRDFLVPIDGYFEHLLAHAQRVYGPDARTLLPLPELQADPDVRSDHGLVLLAGAFSTKPPNNKPTTPLIFTSASALQRNVGALLNTASVPFRVVGPDSDVTFDPTSFFFYQDNRRCYYVSASRYYQWGSAWLPVAPSNPYSAPFEARYQFHRFYHPYARLFGHELSSGGFPVLYDRNLQLKPDTIDPTGADTFSFTSTYSPATARVTFGEDKEIVDFSPDAAYSVYNWELFFHTPLYIAERLSQNQRFEDALKWFHFLFDPTRQGPEPVPQRFWIPKPLNSLTSAQILQQNINRLLSLVNQGDPAAVAQVRRWRKNPFNPFLLADQRPVAYMKRVVMSYLDNLISWGDNLFSIDSREALNEATLLYVMAAQILGPQPVAITPPQHADDSFVDLEPKLDAFANALVDIENVIGAGGGGGAGASRDGMPRPQTFYFKIPPNDKLLGYWRTVADRLFKLRHCQNIAGVTRQLALFDAPIDPELLIKAQAAGVDLGSVLSDLTSPLPNYRFGALYTQALDFVNAVRGYGAQLMSALERQDEAALATLLVTSQRQLQQDADQIYQWRIDEAQKQIDAFTQGVALAQSRFDDSNTQAWANDAEKTALVLKGGAGLSIAISGILKLAASDIHPIGLVTFGAAGFGGTPIATLSLGGTSTGDALDSASDALKDLADVLDKTSDLAKTVGEFNQRSNEAKQKAAEASIQIQQANAELAAASVRLQMATQEQTNHQAQIDRLQQEIDFLTNRFTNADLYDWIVRQLADTYFQSYRLAYRLCKQVERCYRYELGMQTSSFVQFGYWDSLRKGLLAGEMLDHDLRRMQASYLDQNARRFEISRNVSLAALDPQALLSLLGKGVCDFDLPESLFDSDYPGHYARHIARVSVTAVYPNPGKFDNVKGTLTLVRNSVRVSTDFGSGYRRTGANDPRFVDQYGVSPQKIVLGNAQDDAGLFQRSLESNLVDPRYLPFEGAGVISSWHLEIPAVTNEIDLSAIGDVVLHLHYMALDGGDTFKQAVQADNAANLPTSGAIVLSAVSDFQAPAPTDTLEYPPTPWRSFVSSPPPNTDQTLVLNLSPARFPNWTRGKTITVTGLTVLASSWTTGNFVLRPQAPLPTADVNLTPVAGVTEPNVASGTVTLGGSPPLGPWTFKLRTAGAPDFRSLTENDIGDLLILASFQVA